MKRTEIYMETIKPMKMSESKRTFLHQFNELIKLNRLKMTSLSSLNAMKVKSIGAVIFAKRILFPMQNDRNVLSANT